MNVLWIVTTQWRASACGFAGVETVRTPQVDLLARTGRVYAQAVTPHPFGPFARAALLTGVESPDNGVRDYFDPLPRNSRTIAHRLNDRGISTAFFGKWHLAARDPAAPLVGEAHARTVVAEADRGGFAFWEGFESGFVLNDPWLHGTRLPVPTQFRGYQSDVVCGRAGEWITAQAADAASWFCVASLEPPHPPYAAAPAGFAIDPSTVEVLPNVPRGGEVEARARRELAGYYGQIAATDAAIGQLLARIDRFTTAVVFTSVHGDMHGAHGCFRKGWPHEESVRVPLIVAAPGLDPGVSAEAVTLTDLGRLTEQLFDDGSLPRQEREFARVSMPSVVRLPDQCDRAWSGLRSPQRKFIWDDSGAPWLCFDLEADPWEKQNLAGEPARAHEMLELRARLSRLIG